MELTVISTFAGCGGSSLGYKMAGFKELLAIEYDSHAVETFRLNFDCPIWEKDIREVTGKEILNFCNIKKGDLDIFDGSPPCQGFSTAGNRNINDSRNDLFIEYKRLVNDLQPKIFVMENVTGMAKGKMKGKFIETLSELKELNYNVKCKVMNSKYYGVPQSRERLIFIGIKKELNINPMFPEPSNKIITVKKAIEHLENSSLENIEKFKNIKQGEKIYNYGTSEMRIFANKPSRTIRKTGGTIGGNIDIHYKKNRRLLIDELKILSSFPEDFKFLGKDREKVDRIGNSVMPKFMQAIAECLRDNVLLPYYKISLKDITNETN